MCQRGNRIGIATVKMFIETAQGRDVTVVGKVIEVEMPV